MRYEDLIPKDKSDIETAKLLKQYSIEELKSIVPQLLACMQDGNWPIFVSVSDYLKKHVAFIEDEIVEIFKTNDDVWKYWLLINLGEKIKDERLISEIRRIAVNPTASEKSEELDEICKKLIIEKDW